MKVLFLTLVFAAATKAEDDFLSRYTWEEHEALAAEMGETAMETVGRELEIFTGKVVRCNGDNECCSSSNQCSFGEGDCDSNSDCIGDLVCAEESCGKINNFLKANLPAAQISMLGEMDFSESDDCCWYREEISDYAMGMVELQKKYGQAGAKAKMREYYFG